MNENPTTSEAAQTLVNLVKTNGSNLLVWLVLAITTTSPAILQQVHSTRAPGGADYLSPADFHIIGPDRVGVGELVRLTVKDCKPTDVCWYTPTDSQNYGTNGSDLVFSSPEPGSIEVTCSIIKNGLLYLTSKTIEVTTSPDSIVPEEDPEDPERGPIKLTSVGRRMKTLAAQHGISESVAKNVAKNLREAAETMADKTPRALVAETKKLNKPVDLSDGASEAIAVMLQTFAEEGSLASMEQHISAWNDMADGLDAHAHEIR